MKPPSRRPARNAAFSLIELILVLALMITLTTLMYGFASARHQQTRKELCRDQLQKIFLGLQVYANDFRGALPQDTNAQTSEAVLATLVPRYAADPAIFICPGGRDAPIPAGESLRLGRISYAYYEGTRLDLPAAVLMSDRQVDTRPKHPDEFIFSPDGRGPGNNHHQYGGNFLFADGSAQSSPAKLSLPLVVVPGAVLLNPKP